MSTGAGPSGVRIWVTCLLNGFGVVRGVVSSSDQGFLLTVSSPLWATIQDRETCRILSFELFIDPFEILSVKILFGIIIQLPNDRFINPKLGFPTENSLKVFLELVFWNHLKDF